VVIRIVRDHKNHREVAQALGITVKAVEKQMARAYRLARRAAVDGSYQMARRSGGVHKKGRGGGA
jgi:DNA-directed RNA polymerase specialized sigma24 family protein